MKGMTTNLTQPLSKRLFFALLIITIGAEVDLYLTRYSALASTIYDAIMVSSLFVGLKISTRITHQPMKASSKKTNQQLFLQFTSAFLIFFLGSSLINLYSNSAFRDFSLDYHHYVQTYTSSNSHTLAGEETASHPKMNFYEQIDSIGYDIYSDLLAGLEEVWRLAYVILLLTACKKNFPHRWNNGSRDLFVISALFITSILFGIDHTLDTEQAWSIRVGAIVTFANMGLLFGLILLWTRSLWVTVIVHSVYDISTTISWFYFPYAVEVLALIISIIHLILFTTSEKRKEPSVRPLEPVKMAK